VSDPPPLDTLRAGLPPGLAAVVTRAMHRDPAARYQTAREFGEAIGSLETPSWDEPPRRQSSSGRWLILAAVGAVAVLVAALLARR
jgi:hypothetical protein